MSNVQNKLRSIDYKIHTSKKKGELQTIHMNKNKEFTFEYKERIGKGTFGVVYKIRQVKNSQKNSTIKSFKKNGMAQNDSHGNVHKPEEDSGSFFALKTTFEDNTHHYREISILESLSHPNFIKLIDYSELVESSGKVVQIMMEYVKWCLKDVIEKELWREIYKNHFQGNKMELEKSEDKNFYKLNRDMFLKGNNPRNTSFEKELLDSTENNILTQQSVQTILYDDKDKLNNSQIQSIQESTPENNSELDQKKLNSCLDDRIILEQISEDLLYQGFSGLAYLHSLGISHRDIKPSNILLTQNGQLKFCDLGSAKKMDTPSTTYICSRYYRAPENIIGLKLYTVKIDCWSLALSLLEVLTKKPIFKGTSNSDQLDKILSIIRVSKKDLNFMKLRREKNENAQGIRTFLRQYINSKDLIRTFEKCIRFNSVKRYSADEMVVHLEKKKI